jgi:MFS family permease
MASSLPLVNSGQVVSFHGTLISMHCANIEAANIGLISSKTSATPVRGRYYAVAASLGKVGAFVGTYVFPIIQDNAPNELRAGQDPFWVASSLALFSGAITLFCLPDIKQDTIDTEDRAFRAYLRQHGYDTAQMGLEGAPRASDDPSDDNDVVGKALM